MKAMKKMMAVLLSAVMVLAMGITAFATEGDETSTPSTYQYEIYQIFTGDYYNGILSNVKWGKNGNGTEGAVVDSNTLTTLQGVDKSISDREKLDIIKQYANLSADPFQTANITNEDGSLTVENLPNGYYLVKDVDNSVKKDDAYTTYVVQVVNSTLTIERKAGVPTVKKEILEKVNGPEGTNSTTVEVDTNEASVGDTVKYRITGTLPTRFDDYKEYYYVFTDTLSKGLTYEEDSLTVTVDGKDLTKYFYKYATEYNKVTGTTITVGIENLKALNNLADVTLTKDSKIVITYSATLNVDAVIAGTGNPNNVKLAYSNDPNDSGDGTLIPPPENPGKPETTHPTGETPEDKVVTYTTELTILKTDKDNKILAGAEFKLTGNGVNVVLVTTEEFTEDENGAYWKLKNGTYTMTAPITAEDETNNSADYESTTTKYSKTEKIVAKGTDQTEKDVVGIVGNEDGLLTFTGLGAGTYKIEEIEAPAGYNKVAPIEFTISFDANNEKFVSSKPDVVRVGDDNMLDTTIINESGAELPSTGGMGTTIFYILGAILVIGAGVLLIVRRRMNAEK